MAAAHSLVLERDGGNISNFSVVALFYSTHNVLALWTCAHTSVPTYTLEKVRRHC